MVDPDNRRPVDFERRIDLLAELQGRDVEPELGRELLANWDDGRIKLYVTWKALGLRRTKAGLFASGAYLPMESAGPAKEHVCALARHTEESWVIAAVPLLPVRRATGAADPGAIQETKHPVGTEFWTDTTLILPAEAPSSWQNIFTGETVSTVLDAESTVGSSPFKRPTGAQILPLDKVLGTFPVALLIENE
jgi:(1->4)-alpha-D-glucan 1-alpha-D-glucosylmutase